MKGNLALVGLLLATMNANAAFYAGIGVGPEMANFDQKAFVNKPATTQVRDTTHLAGRGGFGSIFAGYSWLIQQFFLAAEFNANYSTDTEKSNNNEFLRRAFATTEYRMRSSYGISALPGYLMPNAHTLFYGRLGYNSGNFQLWTQDTSLKSINRHLNGFRYGLGILERLTDKISVRMEYSQVFYQNTSFSTLDTNSDTFKHTTIAPTTSLVEFGVVYNFGC